MTTAFSSSMPPADVETFLSQMRRPPPISPLLPFPAQQQDARAADSNFTAILNSPIPNSPMRSPIIRQQGTMDPRLLQAAVGTRPFARLRDAPPPRGGNALAPVVAAVKTPTTTAIHSNNDLPQHDDDNDDDDDDDGFGTALPLALSRLLPRAAPTPAARAAEHRRLTTVYDPRHPPPDDAETRAGTALGLRPGPEDRLFHHQTLRLGRWCGMTGQRVARDELLDFEKKALDWEFERPPVQARCRAGLAVKLAAGRGCLGGYLRRRRRIPKYEITVRRRASTSSSAGGGGGGGQSPRGAKPPRGSEKGLQQARGKGNVTAAAAAAGPSAQAAAVQGRRATNATRNEATSGEAATTIPTTASPVSSTRARRRGPPKSPVNKPQEQQQQQRGLPPRFFLPDGRVDTSTVLSEQMAFMANGGTPVQFFATYPGLQDMMAWPDRRARVTEVDDAGNEIPDDAPPRTTRRQPQSSNTSRPAPAFNRKRRGQDDGAAAATAAKSLLLDRTDSRATTAKNVRWAPLPGEQQQDEGEGENYDDDDDVVEGEIPRHFLEALSLPQRTSQWSPADMLGYGWR